MTFFDAVFRLRVKVVVGTVLILRRRGWYLAIGELLSRRYVAPTIECIVFKVDPLKNVSQSSERLSLQDYRFEDYVGWIIGSLQ